MVINGRPMSNTDPMLDLNEFLGANETGYRTAAVFPLTKERTKRSERSRSTQTSWSHTPAIICTCLNRSRGLLRPRCSTRCCTSKQWRARRPMRLRVCRTGGRCMRDWIKRWQRRKSRAGLLTVLSFNLTGMRAINDTYGYQAGDRVLVEAAEQLRRAVEDHGMLSRIAGGEFICLLSGQRSRRGRIAGRAGARSSRPLHDRGEIGPACPRGVELSASPLFLQTAGALTSCCIGLRPQLAKRRTCGKNEDAHYVSKELRLVLSAPADAGRDRITRLKPIA